MLHFAVTWLGLVWCLLLAPASETSQVKKLEASFAGKIKWVEMMGKREASVVPVGIDPRWLVAVEIVCPAKSGTPFGGEGQVILAIHSPVRLFADKQESLPGRTYWFTIDGQMEGGRPRYDTVSAERLFAARPLTAEGSFTSGIEGPACDKQGNIFAVNFQRQGTIGRVTPDGKSEVFVELPGGSIGNGIRFDRQGIMYVADYTKHNVLRIDPKSRAVAVLGHEARMNQPNDLAIGPDNMLYASDPAWKQGTGQLWCIDGTGKATRLAAGMGTTNGIEVSPDGKTLYVNETVQRKVWAFTITGEHALADKRLLIEFPDFGMDGMRCDFQGNLYITRHGKGTVVKVSPKGRVLREIDVLGKMPTNICFGGPDGRTAYVTEVQHRRLVEFRVDRPGLSWKRWQD